ncbi:MurR/RpiR family transcriptional regulator [Eubacterium barkeri]|uniref:DNA-binding transcriptional regulator, MurR/RpiR family, contains HTH and SIS domains n=1 Tax=Eubacterium barkeri TaxID=1528 RepID=A0A1H3I2L2_EUBBA|nr:MurR/RpiR family transcriptional regulator [Eubacterium barkeri]SDY21399.1 DNA-binding transcriptional regulator, MurR/RpiR family, contains HTH and SIS domains [Eubacterium barkeri]
MVSLLPLIRTKYNTFSKNQKIIADYILNHTDSASMLSITDLAKYCDTSETTVMRFLKKMDYDSYQTFRINLAREVSKDPSGTINDELRPGDSIHEIKAKVISHNLTAVKDVAHSLPDSLIQSVLDTLFQAERIFFFGVGASAAIASDALHKFAKIGLNVNSFPDPHLMNILLSHAGPGDVLFAISHTGESLEVLKTVDIAKNRGVQIIGMTSFSNSTLAKSVDFFLSSSTNDKKYHSEAMASRLVQLTIIDILYLSLFMSHEDVFYTALDESRLAVAKNKT